MNRYKNVKEKKVKGVQEMKVYCYLEQERWKLAMMYENEWIEIEGEEKADDDLRTQLQSCLEILQFLRKWVPTNEEFLIYTNKQYLISCTEKWIPNWVSKGFRIGHTNKMRPHSDLLVKLHAFQRCMTFTMEQHYNDWDMYYAVFPHAIRE